MLVGGFLISGFAEDEIVRVVRDADAFFKHVGTSGEVARVQNLNQAGQITIRLMQSSASNDDLSVLASLDVATSGLAGAVPVLMKDPSGRSLNVAAFGWVKKIPDATFGKDVGSREWVIDCATLATFAGGNN